MRPAAIVVGRFCPVTKGHETLIKKLYDYDKKDIRSFIFVINGEKSSKDLLRNPLTAIRRASILKSFFPNFKIDICSSAYEVIDVLDVQGYYPAYWICGSDRVENYIKLLNYSNHTGKIISVDRNSGTTKNISGSLARQAAKEGDSKLFTNFLPNHKDPVFINSIMKDIQKGLGNG